MISWRVLTNGSVWSYRMGATADGTRLVHTRETPDGIKRFAGWFTGRFLGGQEVHDAELEAGMASGVSRIKVLVDGAE